MATTDQNFTMYAGDAKQIDFAITGVDPTQAASIRWRAHSVVGFRTGASAAVSKSDGSGVTTPDSSTVRVTLAPADTSGLTPGRYKHELEVADSAGNPSTVAVGVMTIRDGLID